MAASSLYHEKQLSALCGVHALNNLLQGPFFGAGDLAQLALSLDDAERALLDDAELAAAASAGSHRIDMNTGDFSIDVLSSALAQHSLQIVNVDHAEVAEGTADQPEAEEGFLVHKSSHWFGLRRVASMWWNVDSKLPRPMLIAEEHLAPFISKLRLDGCSLHVGEPSKKSASMPDQHQLTPRVTPRFSVRGAALPLPSARASNEAGHEAVFHPIDYLLEHPPLDPTTYTPTDLLYTADDEQSAAAAEALETAEALQASEAAAAALQANEWGGTPGRTASPGGAALGFGADADAALAAALMQQQLEELDQSHQAAQKPGLGLRPFWPASRGAGAHAAAGSATADGGAEGGALAEEGLGAKITSGLAAATSWFRPPRTPRGGGGGASSEPALETPAPSGEGVPPAGSVAPIHNHLEAPTSTLPSSAPFPAVAAGATDPFPSGVSSATADGPFSADAVNRALAGVVAGVPSSGDHPVAAHRTGATVADLLSMGFSFDAVHAALECAGGDLTAAQELLLEGPALPSEGPVEPPPSCQPSSAPPSTVAAAATLLGLAPPPTSEPHSGYRTASPQTSAPQTSAATVAHDCIAAVAPTAQSMAASSADAMPATSVRPCGTPIAVNAPAPCSTPSSAPSTLPRTALPSDPSRVIGGLLILDVD